jgi:RNA recognition motif-containing protein
MWHNFGPRRGEPRGYCFVEYKTREEAVKAKSSMDGKKLLGKSLRVRFSEERVNYSEASEVVVDLHRYDNKGGSDAPAAESAASEDTEQSLDRKMDALRQRIQQMQENDKG